MYIAWNWTHLRWLTKTRDVERVQMITRLRLRQFAEPRDSRHGDLMSLTSIGSYWSDQRWAWLVRKSWIRAPELLCCISTYGCNLFRSSYFIWLGCLCLSPGGSDVLRAASSQVQAAQKWQWSSCKLSAQRLSIIIIVNVCMHLCDDIVSRLTARIDLGLPSYFLQSCCLLVFSKCPDWTGSSS